MKNRWKFSTVYYILLIFLIANMSCVSIRKIEYFNDFEKFAEPSTNPRLQKKIMPLDKLNIFVLSTDEQTTKILNFAEVNSDEQGYLVDEEGYISFPFVDKINVKGLTTNEAAEKIKGSINRLVSNPVVIVNYLNNLVTILGEVNQQGMHQITKDRINIYEAIALGGGITEWGDRRKIVLMRIENNEPRFHTLNLSNSKVAYDEFFYILPNDIVFVEPLRSKVYRNTFYYEIAGTIGTIGTIITSIILYTRLW